MGIIAKTLTKRVKIIIKRTLADREIKAWLDKYIEERIRAQFKKFSQEPRPMKPHP